MTPDAGLGAPAPSGARGGAPLLARRPLIAGAAALLAAPSQAAAPTLAAPTLATLAARRGLLFGTAVTEAPFATDPAYAGLITSQAACLTPEMALKFATLHPAPTRFDFAGADALLVQAGQAGLKVRGHNLVWHLSLPDWVEGSEDLRATMRTHIETVCGRYAGRLYAWDVVNEPIHLRDGIPGGLRDTPWLRGLGPDYIETALRTAAAADPHATLVVNEMDVECEGHYFEARRTALLALLRRLRDRHVPLGAVGIESHLKWGDASFDPDRFASFLDQIAALDLAIHITEFDVADRRLPADPAARDRSVADLAHQYLSVVLAHPAVRLVNVWELSDRYSWLSNSSWTRRSDGARSRGCLYDDRFQPKPIRGAVAAALTGA